MSKNRKENIPFSPYLLVLISLAILVIGFGYYVNFPSETKIYYSIIGVGLFLGAIGFASRPQMFKELLFNKKTALWINDIILILAVIGIGILLSHIAFRRNYRYDVTKNKLYSVSDLTIKTIRELKKEVKLYAFFQKGSEEESFILDLFKDYKRYSDKISYIMVDPQRDPITTQRMNVRTMGTVVVECEANKQIVLPNDLFILPNQISKAKGDTTPKFTGEQAITSAIANVINNQKRVISFITGHNEHSLTAFKADSVSALNQLLVNENYEVVENSLISGDIDERANVVMILSPKKDFIDTEISKLRQYVEYKKGNIILAFDAGLNPNVALKNLNEFIFKEYAVSANYDIVVDPVGYSNNYWTVIPLMAKHDITKPLLDKNLIGMMFFCCSLSSEARNDISHKVLLSTNEQSWSKRKLDTEKRFEPTFNKGVDARGYFNLGILANKTNVASGSTALILGNSYFMTNQLIAQFGNRDLILNSINLLAGNDKMISITPRVLELPTIHFKPTDANLLFSIFVIGVPFMIIFIGGIVYLFRRRVK